MEDEALTEKIIQAAAPILSNPVNPVKNHPDAKAWTQKITPTEPQCALMRSSWAFALDAVKALAAK